MNIEIMIRRYTMQTQLPKKSAQRHINIPPLPLQTIPMHHPKMAPLPFHFTLPPPRRSVNLAKAADDGMPAAVDEMDVDPASEEPTGQQRQEQHGVLVHWHHREGTMTFLMMNLTNVTVVILKKWI